MIPAYLRKELSVLFFIINKKQTTTSEISHELELTKRAVSETLSAINTHFEEHQKLKNFILTKKSGSVQIQSAYRTKALDAAYNLKLQLLKKNTLFNYTILLLTRTSLDQKKVIEELFISTSYLNKLTRTLNEFFSPFNFTIAIAQGKYSLVGSEMNIRLFSYLFLQDSFQDIEWPFKNISLESIHENVPEEILLDSHKRSTTKNRSLYILYAILQTRVKSQNYVIQPTNKFIQTLFKMVQENFDVALIFQQDKFGSLEKDVKKTEIDYFNFLSRIFISDIIPKKEKIQLGKTFSKENHPYCTLSIEILGVSSILINDQTSEDDYFLFHYYITLFNTFYFLVGDTLDCFTNLFIPPLSYHFHVQNEYMSTIKTNLASLTISENHKKFLSNLLYTLYTSEMTSEVTIYLQLSKDFTASFFIENRLSNLFNPEQIMITDNYSLSDVVITDTLERTESNKKIFYLDSIDNENRWKELLFLIQNTYLDKQNMQKERIHL
ncbi:helix-turn-helix domain-containing protein [Listeria innocua]|uniref:helix-turn-helix domain-containing protein n=1 Tax=Listeria monocytogenes TaxID=1639 RepID=UPI000BE08E8B|nr:helix-turn-helix domain-containing protein [Listeria monocytogenes]EKM3310945.1 helix-turn-helix domain-containing protein [Listeria monocytogenes]PDC23327.1 M protein trans-acting positive regulator [Listeria monocytogenes]HCJ4429282.1 helix-turn-helix domain-containing protein [Listeria innocua]HCJ4866168.1 helix-turn-helix domain-containing protein [Listeria innocua]